MIETAKTVIRSPVLSSVLWRPGGLARPIVLAVTGSLALALAAKIQVPFWPVPMTMQSLVVLLIGIAYGSGLGGGTLLLYLAEGLAGLPVFAGPSAGPAYMAGPTAGYLRGVRARGRLHRLARRAGLGPDPWPGCRGNVARACSAICSGRAVAGRPVRMEQGRRVRGNALHCRDRVQDGARRSAGRGFLVPRAQAAIRPGMTGRDNDEARVPLEPG